MTSLNLKSLKQKKERKKEIKEIFSACIHPKISIHFCKKLEILAMKDLPLAIKIRKLFNSLYS
ncbi:hypothetical protein JHK87_014036 [Glycine soja]|nr:hypothetical protein JHK87_014036 [Glycine soja]